MTEALVDLQLTVMALEARVTQAVIVVDAVLAGTVMTVHTLTCRKSKIEF